MRRPLRHGAEREGRQRRAGGGRVWVCREEEASPRSESVSAGARESGGPRRGRQGTRARGGSLEGKAGWNRRGWRVLFVLFGGEREEKAKS
jgi:hypothetical protein